MRELAPSVATGAAPAVWCSPDLGNVYLKGQNHHAEQHLECCSSYCLHQQTEILQPVQISNYSKEMPSAVRSHAV